MRGGKPLVVNGWTSFADPVFLAQLEALTEQVDAHKRKDPAGYVKKNAGKRLAAIATLAVRGDPAGPHPAGLPAGQPGRRRAQALVDTKRAYESAGDAYRVFRRMLDSGRPPSDWDRLLAEARVESERLARLASSGGA